MNNVLIIKDMNCENCAAKITKALENTRVEFDVNLSKKCVIIKGNYDLVAVARKAISDIGFTIL